MPWVVFSILSCSVPDRVGAVAACRRESGRVDGVLTRHAAATASVPTSRSSRRRRCDATSDDAVRVAQVDNGVFALIVFGMYCVTVFFIILSMFFAMVSAAARTRVSSNSDTTAERYPRPS